MILRIAIDRKDSEIFIKSSGEVLAAKKIDTPQDT
jgi:hypothetical protein